jgi:MauM/NapG family ferredoxin protein
LVRAGLLLAAVVTLLPGLGETRLPLVVPALSPFVAVATVVATRTFPLAAWIGIGIGVMTVVRRRWFCRWVCPTGTCADVATRAGLSLGRRRPNLLPLGQWIVWLTLGGAVLGYPLLLWLDPLALFSGVFGVLHESSMVAGVCFAAGIAIVLLLSLVWPGIWCSHICPLGATQDGLAQCGGLLRSVTTRIRQTADSDVPSPPLAQPDSAGQVGARGEPSLPAVRPEPARQVQPLRGLRRRTLLGAALSAAVGFRLAATVGIGRASAAPLLRPPGALDESRFAGVCVRCGNCLRACPANIIRLDLADSGISGLLTPQLEFREDYCREDCVQCTRVCPSGALTELAIEDKPRISIGVPRVDLPLCKLYQGLDCYDCRNRCPYGAIKLEWSETEYSHIPLVDTEKCNGCGACEAVCPTTPDKAIVVVPRPKK